MQDMQEFNNLSSLVQMGGADGDKNTLDKKSRREIANSNERRRMQSINTGFLRLKALVPSISKEKVSKATILQQTAEYIEKLEREKKQMRQLLQAQNPSFKNSEIMILPNTDSEKDVKEEIPNTPQVPEPMGTETSTSPVESNSILPGINAAAIERTRQMLLSAQVIQSLAQMNQPILNSPNAQNTAQLSSIIQAMEILKNVQSSNDES